MRVRSRWAGRSWSTRWLTDPTARESPATARPSRRPSTASTAASCASLRRSTASGRSTPGFSRRSCSTSTWRRSLSSAPGRSGVPRPDPDQARHPRPWQPDHRRLRGSLRVVRGARGHHRPRLRQHRRLRRPGHPGGRMGDGSHLAQIGKNVHLSGGVGIGGVSSRPAHAP